MVERTRRELLRLGGRAAAAATIGGLATRGAWLASAATRTSASDGDRLLDRDLRVGHLPITDASALLVAHHRGLWADAGLPSATPAMFRGWDALAQAFVVGEVDVVHLLLPLAIQLKLAAKAPITVIGWGHTNGSALTVAPHITRTEQLAGTTVAIPSWWSVHSVLTQRLLASADLTPVVRRSASRAARTVELVVMPPAEMVSALGTGAIAGFVVADPFNAMVEVKEIGHVHRFLGDVWRDHACCAIAVRTELIEQNPGAVRALASGVVQAQSWLHGHRTEAGTLLHEGKYLPQPVPALDKVFTRQADDYAQVLANPTWGGEQLGFTSFPHASYTSELVSLMQSSVIDGDTSFLRGLDPTSVHGALVNDSFTRDALQSLGQPVEPRTEALSP
ncbi:MAG: ABC transporter substrate-binding protein [Propionibacteriaceae bacterium]|nr:ABC transporter substrate-binding protein [Propionibacteriaceae bacterium]